MAVARERGIPVTVVWPDGARRDYEHRGGTIIRMGLVPRIAEVTHELLGATGGATEFDLVSTLAYPLPVTVITELLGLPASDHELFRTWADKLLTLDAADPDDPEFAEKFDEATAELLASATPCCVSTLIPRRGPSYPRTARWWMPSSRRCRTTGRPFTQIDRVTTAEVELSGQIIPADAVIIPSGWENHE